ncbi:unnamed protein product, partial [Brassica rapa]
MVHSWVTQTHHQKLKLKEYYRSSKTFLFEASNLSYLKGTVRLHLVRMLHQKDYYFQIATLCQYIKEWAKNRSGYFHSCIRQYQQSHTCFSTRRCQSMVSYCYLYGYTIMYCSSVGTGYCKIFKF